jgi:hypothetical protein
VLHWGVPFDKCYLGFLGLRSRKRRRGPTPRAGRSAASPSARLDNEASPVIGIDKEAKYLKMAAKRVREG